MSYCRTGVDSDVYLMMTSTIDRDHFQCVSCLLAKGQTVKIWLNTFGGALLSDGHTVAITHLIDHMAAGHKVPEGAIQRIRVERELIEEQAPKRYVDIYDIYRQRDAHERSIYTVYGS